MCVTHKKTNTTCQFCLYQKNENGLIRVNMPGIPTHITGGQMLILYSNVTLARMWRYLFIKHHLLLHTQCSAQVCKKGRVPSEKGIFSAANGPSKGHN